MTKTVSIPGRQLDALEQGGGQTCFESVLAIIVYHADIDRVLA